MEVAKAVQSLIRQNSSYQGVWQTGEEGPAQASQNNRTDVLKISQAAREAAQQKTRQMEMLRQQLEAGNQQAKETAKGFETKLNCILIAIRVMNGDRVPLKDMQYLRENEPEMYAQAILLRRKNDRPKDYKSVVEKRGEGVSETGTEAEAQAVDSRQILAEAAENFTAEA